MLKDQLVKPSRFSFDNWLFGPEKFSGLSRNRLQDIITRVWRRCLKECVPALNSRPKWTSEVQDLKVGDVVLVIHPAAPRGRLPLGRIVEVYPGRDGHTRVAKVAWSQNCLETNSQTDSSWN